MKKIILGLLVLATIGAVSYWAWFLEDELPEGSIQASGRIEGDEITIAADVSGRIVELTAREGERVEAGQVLVRLDDRAVRARVNQVERALDAARAALQRARGEHEASQARLEAQGQRTLSSLYSKDLHQEVVVPTSDLAFPFDAVLRWMLLQ